jgi:cobalamin-dependent methionine synthase I
VLPAQLVTAGSKTEEFTAKMFAAKQYRDYYELNGLVTQLTEALAEFWHARICKELVSPPRSRRTRKAISGSTTAARAFRLATPRARTWRTAAR